MFVVEYSLPMAGVDSRNENFESSAPLFLRGSTLAFLVECPLAWWCGSAGRALGDILKQCWLFENDS